MLCGCGCALIFFESEARHHLVHDGVGVVEDQFINCISSISEFKMSFAEVMFEIVPCFVRLVCAFPRLEIFVEDLLPIEDNEGEVYCLILSQCCFERCCVFKQVVDGVEDDVNWLGCVVDHCLDGGDLVVKFLWGDASIVVVKELNDGWDKWCNLSGDGFAKGGKMFGVNGRDDLLDEGSFEVGSLNTFFC